MNSAFSPCTQVFFLQVILKIVSITLSLFLFAENTTAYKTLKAPKKPLRFP